MGPGTLVGPAGRGPSCRAMTTAGNGGRTSVSAPERGASMVQYGAALLLVGALAVTLTTTDVPRVVEVKTRAAICAAFQGDDCATAAAGAVPRDQGPGQVPAAPA